VLIIEYDLHEFARIFAVVFGEIETFRERIDLAGVVGVARHDVVGVDAIEPAQVRKMGGVVETTHQLSRSKSRLLLHEIEEDSRSLDVRIGARGGIFGPSLTDDDDHAAEVRMMVGRRLESLGHVPGARAQQRRDVRAPGTSRPAGRLTVPGEAPVH